MPDPSPPDTPQQNPEASTTPVQGKQTFWTALGQAVKTINISEDLSNIGQVPCARNSLMGGIASGFGVGFIRGMTAGPWVACNWAVGSFLFVSFGTWQICRTQIINEHKRMQVLVDSMPRLRRKRPEELQMGRQE